MPKPLWAPWRLEYIEQADELDRCIFCEPEEELLVHSGEHVLVVLNKYPYSSGHLLVAPHRHLDDLGLLSDEEALEVRSVPSTRRTGTTSAGTSAASPAQGSRTTCIFTSYRAGTAIRASCPCSPM